MLFCVQQILSNAFDFAISFCDSQHLENCLECVYPMKLLTSRFVVWPSDGAKNPLVGFSENDYRSNTACLKVCLRSGIFKPTPLDVKFQDLVASEAPDAKQRLALVDF